jgi:hypothetical protein
MQMFRYLTHLVEVEAGRRRKVEFHARRRDRGLERRVEALEEDLGQMALFVRTLFRMLCEKGTIQRAEFMEVARAIDAQDGTTDGKYTGPADAP